MALLPAVPVEAALTPSIPSPHLRLLPAHLVDPEPAWKRRLFEAIAALIAVGFFYVIISYWMPAHPGVDQNGYLVGGKMVAQTGSSGFKPDNPFQFVGMMWVMIGEPGKDDVWYYPKYPIGLPLLDALPLWINWEHGKAWALFVSPLGAALGVLGMFFLARQVAGSFVGIMAMILLAMNVTTLGLANNPNSHAPALAFVVWGMFMLLRWWQTGSIWRGVIAGFLLGYAVTIRYSEGLLLLPMLVAVFSVLRYERIVDVSWWRIAVCLAIAAAATWLRIRVEDEHPRWIAIAAGLLVIGALTPWWRLHFSWKSHQFWRGAGAVALVVAVIALNAPGSLQDSYERNAMLILGLTCTGLLLFIYSNSSWRRAAVPLLAWCLPVLWLFGFNWFAMGSITGYDTTNESTGFSMGEFQGKWEFTVQQLYDYGAFFVLPLTVLGLVVMWRWNWRVALASLLWLIPGVILYAAYYWGNDLQGMSYLRFFLTLVPAMILPAVWMLRHGGWFGDSGFSRGSIAMPVACGILVAICAVIALRSSIPALERDQVGNANLYYTCETIASNVPAGSVVFADQRGGGMSALLNFIQWRGDYELYAADAFNSNGGQILNRLTRGLRQSSDRPNPRQSARAAYLRDNVYSNLSDQELIWEQNAVIRDALAESPPRRAFVVVPLNTINAFRGRYISSGEFELKLLRKWNEPVPALPDQNLTPLMLRLRGFGPNRGPLAWQLYEIVSKAAPAAATTSPAARK